MSIAPPHAGRPFALLAALTIALAAAPAVSAQGRATPGTTFINGREAVSGEVLVKFRSAAPADRGAIEQQVDAAESEELSRDLRIRRIRSRFFSVETLIAFLRNHPADVYVEPNYVLRASDVPQDPQFGDLWGLQNTGQSVRGAPGGTPGSDIDAASAWALTTGSPGHVVAVIDSGIDYNHQDLSANVWSAPSAFVVTIGGNTIVCAAGTHGFNAITNSCDPMDDNNHGTHVAGTIGAVGDNGVGVAGVNWTASIMGSKFLNSFGSGTLANAIKAIEFTIQAKTAFAGTGGANVRVLNNSWGGSGYSQALLDEIDKARANDMLFVAAAGNNGLNNDVWGFYPADYTYWGATNIVAVAATDNNDQLASFSNYGPTLVHLGAPGVNILSTTRGNTYEYFSGTSMAAPHVSGAAALVLSRCALTTAALKATILDHVDVVGGLTGWVASGGRLNIDAALRSCAATSPPGPPTDLTAAAGNGSVALNWTASAGAASYDVKRSTTPGSGYAVIATVTTTSHIDTGLDNGTTYYYVVSASNSLGVSGNSNEASATPTAPLPPPAPTGLTASSGPGRGQIALLWNASPGATSYNVKRRAWSGTGWYSTVATGVTATSYVDGNLKRGKVYYYVVSAVNAVGESANSNQASAAAAR
jgi:subtilisin family serine protease